MLNRFTPFLLGFVFFSLTAKADDKPVFTCWDLSYHMKYVSMIETENRFELAVQGGGLGPASFTRYDEVIVIDHLSLTKKIYIPFNKSDCQIAADGQSGHCERTGNILWDSFFIAREIDNLWDKVNTITGMPSTHIVLDYSPYGIKFTIQGAFDPAPQSIEFSFGQCYDPKEYSISFPDALRSFLDKYFP